jgi:hypothetical protein
MKLKLINILIGLIIPILLKGTSIMKITFLPTSTVQTVELTPEDLAQLVAEIKSILTMMDNSPRIADSFGNLIKAISSNI